VHKRNLVTLAALLTTAGCGILEPTLPEADPDVAPEWPIPPTTTQAVPAPPAQAVPGASVTEIGWRDFFTDPNLEELIAASLENNRDLRVAVLNVERARGLYRIQRADRVPSLNASASMTRGGGQDLFLTESYSAEFVVPGFELDLFGRVRNLSEAALRDYLAQEEARRAAQLSLIAEVANAYLTLVADRELQRVSEAALKNRQEELSLTERRFELGAASSLEVNQAQIEVETARSDVWQFAGQVAQDINALTLLTGTSLDPALLSAEVDLQASGLEPLPAGLPSDVLLRRPDVQAAEYRLRAANALIGAARAAFFPSITLTGSFGTASTDLSNLFESGTDSWSFIPQIVQPIFQGGRLRANADVAHVDRDIALAQYERTIQASFREVADSLALTQTLERQRDSREALLAAALRANDLSRIRYEAGSDSYLVLLDAQRTLYAAQQALVSTRLAEQSNRVNLYKALGGGWLEQ
jgi:multidrug efflux system outer membrane protein